MKQKDILLIAVAIIISSILSIVISNMLITAPKNRQQKVEIVDAISSEFPSPDTKYFNSKAFDPIRLIRIGNNANNQPFNNRSQ